MKKHKKNLLVMITLLMSLAISILVPAQGSGDPPPPPEQHGQNTNQPPGGGTPLGEGILLLAGLAIAYGYGKALSGKNKTLVN